jgi:hypothetical protein
VISWQVHLVSRIPEELPPKVLPFCLASEASVFVTSVFVTSEDTLVKDFVRFNSTLRVTVCAVGS